MQRSVSHCSDFIPLPPPHTQRIEGPDILVNFLFVSSKGIRTPLFQHLFVFMVMITVILNGLPWKRTDIILSFLGLHPSTAFWTLVYYDDYSISSKEFLPTVVDIMVI